MDIKVLWEHAASVVYRNSGTYLHTKNDIISQKIRYLQAQSSWRSKWSLRVL